MIIKNAQIYSAEHIFKIGSVSFNDRIKEIDYESEISRINGLDVEGKSDECIDAEGLMLIPGLVDVHFHGADGVDFSDADADSLNRLAEYELRNGVLNICPATMSYDTERILNILEISKSYSYSDMKSDLVGINLEGPFINPKRSGAQDTRWLCKPNEDIFEIIIDKAEGLVKLVDLAPELEGALELIRTYKNDIHFSIAHTEADYETACEAFNSGADHVTHLFNAMEGIKHRTPGPIIAAKEKNAYVELITDGIHVHPAMVRFVFDYFDKNRIVIISDSMRACGLGDGVFDLGGQEVVVESNMATLRNKREIIAGSVSNQYDCFKAAVLNMGISLEDAIMAVCENPAASIGIDKDYGSIERGKYANMLLINDKLEIVSIIHRGQLITL